jgi:(R)-2-hydroxyacyl-CoA dehydratese activating ATPase
VICAGVDSGSRALKIVLLDTNTRQVVARASYRQLMREANFADRMLQELLEGEGIDRRDVAGVIATGYGRQKVSGTHEPITEITCHARGVREIEPAARSIVEIGGQDSKVIRLDSAGRVRDFAMNDRCAAGTGRFLEMVADLLGLDLQQMGAAAAESRDPVRISSTCAVFAESEILGLMTDGTAVEAIAAGVQHAVASRVCAMAGENLVGPVAFTGGVAAIPGMASAIASYLDAPVTLVDAPQYTGALGAALFAADACAAVSSEGYSSSGSSPELRSAASSSSRASVVRRGR